MSGFVIRHADLVNEGRIVRGDLHVVDGQIAEVVDADGDEQWITSLPPDTAVVDGRGCYLIPGVIDTHVHFRDGGDSGHPAGDFSSESRAALAGGVTSVIDMPNTNPPTVGLKELEVKELTASRCSVVNYGFMLGVTNSNIDTLLAVEPERYAALKLFLGSSTGNMLVDDNAVLDRLFGESRKVIVAHCEAEGVVQRNLANLRAEFAGTDGETAALHPKVRNVEACFLSTYHAVERARRYKTHLHIAHLSTATELSLLSNQSLDEKTITAEVTPNHLWFDDRDYAAMGNLIKCNPSIKSNDDRLALWAALEDGLIDTIATDHAPHLLGEKQKRYFEAPSGIPSIQHSLQMMLEPLMNDAQHEMVSHWLPLLVEKMCHNPARIFHIGRRGYLRPGYHADLVLVRPCPEGQTVQRSDLRYKCGWSPIEGMTFHSRIERVWVNGNDCGEACAAQALQYRQ